MPIFSQCIFVLVYYWFYIHGFSQIYVRIWLSNIHTKLYRVHKDLYTCRGNNYEKSLKADSNRYEKWSIYTYIYIYICIYIYVSWLCGFPNKFCRNRLKFKLLESVRNGTPCANLVPNLSLRSFSHLCSYMFENELYWLS